MSHSLPGIPRHKRLRALSGLVSDEYGSTAIEYALIAAFLSIAIVTALGGVGSALVGFFNAVAALF